MLVLFLFMTAAAAAAAADVGGVGSDGSVVVFVITRKTWCRLPSCAKSPGSLVEYDDQLQHNDSNEPMSIRLC